MGFRCCTHSRFIFLQAILWLNLSLYSRTNNNQGSADGGIPLQPDHSPAKKENCKNEWFGPNCEFSCNCVDMACAADGNCVNSTCFTRYFGPSCQYIDLALNLGYKNKGMSYLIDQNASTCNPNASATSLKLVLDKTFQFTWIRLVIKNTKDMVDFQLKSGNSTKWCVDLRIFKLSATVVDVICNSTSPISTFTVVGKIAGTICSLHISGGHSVALRQKTNQSTIFSNMKSSYAVDGSTSLYSQSCSRTLQRNKREWWSVTFSDRQLVKTVYIVEEVLFGARYYILQLFNENKQLIGSFDLKSAESRGGAINVNSQEFSKSMMIYESENNSVALCEVTVFAETMCPDGLFGLNCDQVCNCTSDQMCNSITGACGKGCHGTHNYKCNNPCSRNCLKSNCVPGSVNCPSCRAGFTGKMCRNECPDMKFGENCSSQCNKVCEGGLCNKVTGTCFNCSVGYAGPSCQVCRNKTYGESCKSVCSKNCFDGLCNHVNGHCYKCKTGYMGPFCNACPLKTYGDDCKMTCSKSCLLGLCYSFNGHCIKCDDGYYGPECKECPPLTYGNQCKYNCSKSCYNQTCYPEDGQCFECNTGYIGTFCKECPQGTYGANCTMFCRDICFNKSCDTVTGDCLQCMEGYSGPDCDACPKRKYGKDCLQTCPVNCRNNYCNPATGDCYECIAGNLGPKCNEGAPESNILITILICGSSMTIIIPACLVFKKYHFRRKSSTQQNESESGIDSVRLDSFDADVD